MEEMHYGYMIHDDGDPVDVNDDCGGNMDDAYELGYEHGLRDGGQETRKQDKE